MLRIIYFLLIFSILTYSPRSVKPITHGTLSVNELHQPVRWDKLPISFYFDPSFPKDKKLIFLRESNRLNSLVGMEVIHVISAPLPPEDDDTNYNIITISRSDDMPFGEREEAKTVTVERKSKLILASIFYNPVYMRPDYDFASITRHELCHALGIQHIGTGNQGLMSPYQDRYQIKEWDESLLQQWKQEMAQAD